MYALAFTLCFDVEMNPLIAFFVSSSVAPIFPSLSSIHTWDLEHASQITRWEDVCCRVPEASLPGLSSGV